MEYRLLGPVEAWRDGAPVALGGVGQRALLARLVLAAGEVVPADLLLEELFPSRNALQAAVSRLRRVLGEEALNTRGPGYLVPAGAWVDAFEFERQVAAAHTLAPAAAAGALREALSLWRGPALADLIHFDFAQPDIRRLEALRLSATCDRINAELTCESGTNLPGVDDVWTTATFLPDGRHLLTLNDSGRGTVWDLDPSDLARRACAVAGRRLTRAEWTAALPDRAYAPACAE